MASVRVKDGVQPRVVRILVAIANVAGRIANPAEVYITSVMDSIHSTYSKHYSLEAVDVRTKNFPTKESKVSFVEALKAELGPQYDVILESVGLPNEHVHVEFERR